MFQEPWLAVAGTVVVIVVVVGLAASWSRAAAESDGWPVVVAAAGTLALLAFLALGQVDELFAGMYPLGTSGRGILHISGDPARARAIVDAWQSWLVDPATRGAPAPIVPITVAQWYIGIDSLVFVLSYSVALGTLLMWARSWLGSDATGKLALDQGINKSSLARFRTFGALALAAFAVVPILDLVENGLLLHFIERRALACPDGSAACASLRDPSDGYVKILTFVSAARWWVLGVALLFALTTAALWLTLRRAAVVALRPAISRVRGPIIVIAAFMLLMWINPQTEDIFRGWGWIRIFFTVGLSFVLAYVTWTVSRRLTYATRVAPLPDALADIRSGRRRVMYVTAAVLGGLTLTGIGELPGPRGLAVPAVLIALFAWFERGTEGLDVDAPPVPTVGKDVVPAIAAAAWPVLLSAFALRSLFPLSMYDHAASFIDTAFVFVFWSVVVPGAGFLLASTFLRSVSDAKTPIADIFTPQQKRGFPLLPVVLIGLGAASWILMAVEPWLMARWLGGMGVILLLFAVATAVVGLGSEFVERVEPPGIFRSMNVGRLPIFLLLAFWLVAVSAIPLLDRADYHDVRVLGGELDDGSAPTDSVGLLARWIDQGAVPTSSLSDGSRPVVPLMFIATDGGGIKAATWTALVLDCLFSEEPIEGDACPEANPDRFASVFAESGVSGGSFGLATYTRRAIEPDLVSGSDDWIHEVLGEDFVSPSLAWQLFVEVPRVWLQFDTGMDRAEVLERGWEQGWPGGGGSGKSRGPLADGFRRLWLENDHMPVLLLNGFTVQDGCKFVSMPIDGNGAESGSWNCLIPHEITPEADPAAGRPGFASGSRSLTDILCGDATDVRMSTAALLSARFPFVSPSGRFKHCGEERAVNVVDGGYGDNSGAGSIVELLASLRPVINAHNSDPTSPYCIVPVMLQIQNGYGPNPDVASVRQSELTAPIKGIIKAPTGFTVWQRNAAQLAVLEPLPGTAADGGPERQGVYALVHPFTHPGAEAPLGWTLSDEAEDDLRVQLHARANTVALQRLADFLDDPGTCAGAPPAGTP